jgi:hypothetical protein
VCNPDKREEPRPDEVKGPEETVEEVGEEGVPQNRSQRRSVTKAAKKVAKKAMNALRGKKD